MCGSRLAMRKAVLSKLVAINKWSIYQESTWVADSWPSCGEDDWQGRPGQADIPFSSCSLLFTKILSYVGSHWASVWNAGPMWTSVWPALHESRCALSLVDALGKLSWLSKRWQYTHLIKLYFVFKVHSFGFRLVLWRNLKHVRSYFF